MKKYSNNYFYIYIIISFIFLFISYLIYINYERFSNQNNPNENIIFINKEDLQNIIRNDKDKYIENLTIYDLRARNVKSSEDYKNIAINSCLDFTDVQKEKLIRCANIAKNFYDNKLNWVFACIDNNYEEGMPHTRMDIIFLSPNVINYNDELLTKTLIHESVHIFQRYNTEQMLIYLEKNNFKISRHKSQAPFSRANPDLNEYIYKDKDDNELIANYTNEFPKSLNDINLKNIAFEHPYEKMAYEIGESYEKYSLSRFIDIK